MRLIAAAALLAAFAVLALCGACAAAESADPIRVSSACDPQSVVSVQDVTVTIRIYNAGQTDIASEITLFGPDGVSVEKYAGLAGEQSVTYTGAWRVTDEQIAAGRINYYIRYAVDTGSGPVENTRTIPVTIKAESAAPQLSATYSITPAAAKEGQEVTLSYTLSNTGNVELRNIAVSNEGVTKETLKAASLSVGERVTLESKITMGAEALVSNPTVTYEAADTGVSLTISDMARRTITLAQDDLEVAVSGEGLDAVYPGESVELAVTVKNTGEAPYNDLSVVLPDGTAAVTGIALEAGATYEGTVRYTALQSGKVSVSVTGLNSDGATVGVASNELDVAVQDASQALILRVRAQARETAIYSQPAVIRFAVVVDNIGEIDATNLSVTEAGVEVAKIPSLPSGESRTLVFDLEASIAGQFQFAVSGRDGAGNERSYESNVMQVAYIEPTPAPTNTPAPTPVPPTPSPVPTATPVPTLADRIAEATAGIDPTALYTTAGVLAGVILLVLVVSGVRSAKRRKRMASALDTLELSPNARDYKGRRRGRKGGKNDKDSKGEARREDVVPASELTEEETRTQSAPQQTPAEGEGRRRPVQEVSNVETLRVAPVDQRPEFVAQRKVDDSATRVFTRMGDAAKTGERRRESGPVVVAELSEDEMKAAAAEPAQDNAPQADAPQEKRPKRGAPERGETLREAGEGETIRLNNAELSELYKRQERKKGATIKNAKPMKKKKKGLFSRGGGDDDVLDDYDAQSDDDDLFE